MKENIVYSEEELKAKKKILTISIVKISVLSLVFIGLIASLFTPIVKNFRLEDGTEMNLTGIDFIRITFNYIINDGERDKFFDKNLIANEDNILEIVNSTDFALIVSVYILTIGLIILLLVWLAYLGVVAGLIFAKKFESRASIPFAIIQTVVAFVLLVAAIVFQIGYCASFGFSTGMLALIVVALLGFLYPIIARNNKDN